MNVRELMGSEPVDEQAVKDWLGHELLRNYVAADERRLLEETFRDLGMPALADHLTKHKFPTDQKVRTGEFGEALGGALFRKVDRWYVPILKLRYKQRPNQPVQGADFVAFRLRGTPPVVAAPEVKTRTIMQLDVGIEAAKSLQGVLDDLPSSIQFVVARLLDAGNALAYRIGRLLAGGQYEVEQHIVLVHDDEQWDERVIDRLADATKDLTETTVIRLSSLRTVVTEAYASAATAPERSRHDRANAPATASVAGEASGG